MKANLALVAGAALCAALAGPALSKGKAKAADHDWINGLWEAPSPGDQLSNAGARGPILVGRPPLKPEYLAKWNAEQKVLADATARGEPIAGENVTECLPQGVPAMMAPSFPMEVIATAKQINITQEAYSQTRRIYLDRKQIAVDDAEPQFYGHSVGHWEGNVLVVNTIGIKERVRMRAAPHSPNMRVDERMYATGPNTFEDKVTITDPEYLTQPWTFSYQYKRKPGWDLNEYVCENNHETADPKTGAQRLDLRNVFKDR